MAQSKTKVFGMDIGVDPKVLILLLIITAAIVYYFTASSDASTGGSSGLPATGQPAARPVVNPTLAARAGMARRNAAKADRDTLKLVAVDGSRGDVDPTLHLGLLERVKNVKPAAGLRNLFDAGGAVLASTGPPPPLHPPIIQLKPLAPVVAQDQPLPMPVTPPFTIPLKYYGFARSSGRSVDGNRGLFMDGDNILIGSEGDMIEKKYLIVALTPNMARLEDTQAKQGQDLQVTPEASAP